MPSEFPPSLQALHFDPAPEDSEIFLATQKWINLNHDALPPTLTQLTQ